MNKEEEIKFKKKIKEEIISRKDELIDAAKRNAAIVSEFIKGAEWADQNPRKGLWDAEKVIDWLNSWFTDDICKCDLPITKDARNTFFNDLRKAMED